MVTRHDIQAVEVIGRIYDRGESEMATIRNDAGRYFTARRRKGEIVWTTGMED